MKTLKRMIAVITVTAMVLALFAGMTVYADPVNLALGASATTSSNYDNSKTGASALDGDTSTYWQPNGDAQKGLDSAFITVDLGSATEFRSMIIRYGSNAYIVGGITVEYSNNGTSWTTAANVNAAGTGSEDYINFNAVTARYVKMSFTDSSSHNGDDIKNWPEVTEVEIYNSVAQKEYGESVLNPEIATILGKPTYEKHKGVDTATFTYGGSGFTVNFTGTKLEMYVPEDIDDRDVTIGVMVDTEMPMEATMMTVKEGWMTLASGLSNGNHTVTVRKQSRGFYGIMASDWFCVSDLRTDGSFLAPNKRSDLVIEVYGDSITNGDAVWYNDDRSNSAWTYGSYSSVVGRLLNAETKVTGNTGNGLLGWVMATKNGSADNLLPPQNSWDKIDPQHNGSPYYHTGENEADVVIINLGTNDRGDYNNGDITLKSFTEEYVRFIKQIKTDCPNAIVICTIGAMGGVEQWAEALGGDGFDYIEYEWTDGTYDDNGTQKTIYRHIAEGAKMNQILNSLPESQRPEVHHRKSVIDQCNEWAGEPFCYYLEIQKCDTIGQNEKVKSYKDGVQRSIPAGAGYDDGHPSNLAHEIYGLQMATLINKVLNLGIDLPDDIPAATFKARTGKDAPKNVNLIEYLTGKTTTLSYVDEVIARSGKTLQPEVSTAAAQVSTDSDANQVRLIAAVNAGKFTDGVSTKYKSVGFEITVYESIADKTSEDFGIEGGKLFCLVINDVPLNCTIEVRALAVGKNTTVYAKGGSSTVFDFAGGNITVVNLEE